MKIFAEMNHGRWIAICPVCREGLRIVAMGVKLGDLFVCPEEYPNIMAMTLVPNLRMKGAFNSVPDMVLREEERKRAAADGNAHELIFPDNKGEIESLLRMRPVTARNWWPEISADDLRRENIEQGVK